MFILHKNAAAILWILLQKSKKCLVDFGFCIFTQKMTCAIIKVYKRELLPSETEIF